MDVQKVKEAIARVESDLAFIKSQVEANPSVNVRVNARTTVRVGNEVVNNDPPPNPIAPDVRSLLDGGSWPEAVPSDLLCSEDEDDKVARAELVLDMVVEKDLKDLVFLDYGCGEGHMADRAAYRGALSARGYDPVPHDSWRSLRRAHFSSDPKDLRKGAYDVILLHDVLDHCTDPLEVLHHVSGLLAPYGVLFACCHPWCSRHGGHLYRQFNKAYAHMVLGPEELAPRGILGSYVQPVLRPVKTYRQWFITAGLKAASEDVKREPMESFLTSGPVWESLSRHYFDQRLSDQEVRENLEIEFVNYALKLEALY